MWIKGRKGLLEILLIIIISLFLCVISIFWLKNNSEEKIIKKEKDVENFEENILSLKPDIEYDKEKEVFRARIFNSLPFDILKIEFGSNGYDKKDNLIFDKIIPKMTESTDLTFKSEKKDFKVIRGLYLADGGIYSFNVKDGVIKRKYIAGMPYLKSKDIRYLVPKIKLVKEKDKIIGEAYLFNITNIEILNYEFVFENALDGVISSIKFRNIYKGDKSEIIKFKAPDSGLLKDILPIESKMKIVIDDVEKDILYNFSNNQILDLKEYNRIMDGESYSYE